MAMPHNQGAESITQAEHVSPSKTGDNIEAKRVVNYVWGGSDWVRATSDAPFATQFDDSEDPILYIGKAPVGSSISDPVWQIAKLDTGSGLSKTWAGNAGFTQVWDDRTSLTFN